MQNIKIISMSFIIGITIILGTTMFFSLDLTNAHSNSFLCTNFIRRKTIFVDEKFHFHGGHKKHHHKSHDKANTNFKSWNFRPQHEHHHHRVIVVHGVINIIGWGILLPIGVIIARYYKRHPMKCEEWYSLHVITKVIGYIFGTIGWGLGMSIRNSTKYQHTMMSTHGIIGTIIFIFTTIQVLAICLQPNEESVYRKYWVIYHNIFGYALLILIIVNIFQGIEKEKSRHIWKWSYIVIVNIMGLIALVLEFLPCFNIIKNKILRRE
ncbi:cytochrome and DOMON domain-containing protein [Capsicum galapagoense]